MNNIFASEDIKELESASLKCFPTEIKMKVDPGILVRRFITIKGSEKKMPFIHWFHENLMKPFNSKKQGYSEHQRCLFYQVRQVKVNLL